MLALRVENKCLSVEDVEAPHAADEALVRVLLSGICNTDLEIARGYAGFSGTIGHEFVGVVEESTQFYFIKSYLIQILFHLDFISSRFYFI